MSGLDYIFEEEECNKSRKEEKIEIAKKLLDVLDDETIAKKTNLKVKEVEALRKEKRI